MSQFSITAGSIPLIIGYTMLGFGYTFPIIIERYKNLHREFLEASSDLGATIHQTFYWIVIPFLKPALLVSFVLTCIITFDDFILAFFCILSILYNAISSTIFNFLIDLNNAKQASENASLAAFTILLLQ